MRIVIAGKGWIAARAISLFDMLGQLDDRISGKAFISCASDEPWMPSAPETARLAGWEAHATVEDAQMRSDDLLLSLQYDRIVREDALHGCRAYNLHFAALPKYRGTLTSVWPIRRNETTVGVTLHRLVASIDAGAIVAAREFPLPRFFSSYDLYVAYHQHGFELLTEQLEALLSGEHDEVDQPVEAEYFSRTSIDFSDPTISDFSGSAIDVANYCRSLIFPPQQLPLFQGREIHACYPLHDLAPKAPGDIVSRTRGAVLVACGEGTVCFELK